MYITCTLTLLLLYMYIRIVYTIHTYVLCANTLTGSTYNIVPTHPCTLYTLHQHPLPPPHHFAPPTQFMYPTSMSTMKQSCLHPVGSLAGSHYPQSRTRPTIATASPRATRPLTLTPPPQDPSGTPPASRYTLCL